MWLSKPDAVTVICVEEEAGVAHSRSTYQPLFNELMLEMKSEHCAVNIKRAPLSMFVNECVDDEMTVGESCGTTAAPEAR